MNQSFFQQIRHTIVDKRLYGPSFFILSVPYLAMGLLIMGVVYTILNPMMFLFYVPIFIILILISGVGSKNYVPKREAISIGRFRGILLLFTSYFAVAAPFFMNFSNDLFGTLQFLVIYGISTLALTIAVMEITIFGQRVSLRDKIHLTDDFFNKQKKIWEKEFEGFPNSEKIINTLEDGKFVTVLFDRGSFNLAILWSCNVMEEIIDALADVIIQKDLTKKPLFKNEKGGPKRYPTQLKNLGYIHHKDVERKSEQISIDDLWDKIRNRIAHHKYKPTFDQTYGGLIIFVSFLENFPKTLLAWK